MHKVLALAKTPTGFILFRQNSRKHQLGFTLIELIIAIVIVVILTTIGVTSFNSAAKANAVQQQAQELKSLARKLRTDATAAIKPTGNCTSSGSVYGTYIAFQTGTANYMYGTACYNSSNPLMDYSTQTTATLPTGMVFASPSQTILYSFNGAVGLLPTYGAPSATNFPSTTTVNYYLEISDVSSGWPGPRDYRLSFSPSGLVCEEKWTTSVCAN